MVCAQRAHVSKESTEHGPFIITSADVVCDPLRTGMVLACHIMG
jgi:hypothetical protein